MRRDGAAGGPFPVVMGYGRSGTTLLRSMLDAHDHFAIAHEGRFLVHAARQRARYERRDGFAVDRFVTDLYTWPKGLSRITDLGIGRAAVHQALLAAAPRLTSEAVRVVYGVYAAAHGKPVAGDKAPLYLLHLPFLALTYPEAQFIHIVRDGRDVALAVLDAAFGPQTLPVAALDWARQVRRARRVGQQLGPERYLEVRYEDLVADPERVLGRVCAYLGQDFSPSMLQYNSPDRIDGLISAQPHLASLRRPLTAGLRNWREQMAGPDQALFEALVGPTLSAFGYDTVHDTTASALPRRRVVRQRLAFSRFLLAQTARVQARTVLTRLR